MRFLSLFIIFILCSLFTPAFVFSDSGNVTRLVFTSDSRVVLPSEISEVVTVQTQNSGGTAEDVTETNDVAFKSSSGTGEFLNSSGNPVSTTMAKGTASRNFYYRDSTNGTHTITVKISGRESGKSFEASQSIIIGQETSGSSTTQNSTSSGSSSSGTSGSSSSGSSGNSSQSSGDTSLLEVSAGQNRTVSAGTPLVLKAKVLKPKNINLDRVRFKWSLGDGSRTQGGEVSHTYLYPGDYTVVLSGLYQDESVSTRIKVKVFESKLAITHAGIDYVEIVNRGNFEEDLGSWSLVDIDGKRFIIPEDTIVTANGSLKLPSTVTGIINTFGLKLLNPSMQLSVEKGLVGGDFKVILAEENVAEKSLNTSAPKTKTDVKPKTEETDTRSADPEGATTTQNEDNLRTQNLGTGGVIFTVEQPKKESWFKRILNFFFR